MGVKHLVPGFFRSVVGLGLFSIDTVVSLSGPQLPDSAVGYLGWVLILGGIGLLKTGAQR